MSAARGWISVYAPATVANVGPGFDCFGFSLGEPGDIVRARLSGEPGVRIVAINGDDGALPLEPERNTAGVAALTILRGLPAAAKFGVELSIDKGLPPCSGLGSSAASAVAGAMATMRALEQQAGLPYDLDLVWQGALAGEALASGSFHGDNVAPALLGGFTIVQAVNPLNVGRFEPAITLRVALVMPKLLIPTIEARAVLPKEVPLRQAVANWANAASLVLALLTGNEKLLRAALHDDIVEPVRARLIPGFDEAKQAALDAGVYGCSISGAGPAIFALAPDDAIARAAADAMAEALNRHGLASTTAVTSISPQGARVL
jgi:homoserine kinase